MAHLALPAATHVASRPSSRSRSRDRSRDRSSRCGRRVNAGPESLARTCAVSRPCPAPRSSAECAFGSLRRQSLRGKSNGLCGQEPAEREQSGGSQRGTRGGPQIVRCEEGGSRRCADQSRVPTLEAHLVHYNSSGSEGNKHLSLKGLGSGVGRRCLLTSSGTALLLGLGANKVAAEEQSAASLAYLTSGQIKSEDELATAVFEAATASVAAVLLYTKKYRDEEGVLEGTGSGFVWDKLGHVITNYHVIARVAEDKTGLVTCRVSLLNSNGAMLHLPARVIGIDPSKDLAVLKVDEAVPEELSPAVLGSSAFLRVGQSCFAVGNPYGLLHTLTAGVVSGLGRAIPAPTGQAILGAIQTDAAINAGNSGGPLLDSSARLIGVNTATFSRKGSGTSSGVNFAVPVDTVVKVVPKIIVFGTPTRAANAFKA